MYCLLEKTLLFFLDIHTPSKMDENYFLASYDSEQRVVSTMMYYGGKCPLCGYDLELPSYEVQQHGHCARVSMNCAAGHSLRCFSSGIVSGKFTANLRLVRSLFFDICDFCINKS